MQSQSKPFNDFFLFELSHLSGDELEKPNALAVLERMLELGKKAILENTKPGDLIAMEAPENFDYKDFYNIFLKGISFEGTGVSARQLRESWTRIDRANMNFYAKLSDYAKSSGRKIVSLEPNYRKNKSLIRTLWLEELAFKKGSGNLDRSFRLRYLVTRRADISFMKRIPRFLPQMVIVARDHAVFLEYAMQPKKVSYSLPITIEQKQKILQSTLKFQAAFQYLKRKRLTEARRKTKLPKAKPK